MSVPEWTMANRWWGWLEVEGEDGPGSGEPPGDLGDGDEPNCDIAIVIERYDQPAEPGDVVIAERFVPMPNIIMGDKQQPHLRERRVRVWTECEMCEGWGRVTYPEAETSHCLCEGVGYYWKEQS